MPGRTSEQDQGANIASLAFAAFAIVLLNAFLSHRALDEGQLGILAGNLGGGPWFGWEGFLNSVVGALIAIAILLSWFGIGRILYSFIGERSEEDRSSAMEFAIACALGAAIWSLF